MSEYKELLLNNILPFWMKNAVDTEFGGILTHLERDGRVWCYDKNVWFMGRAMYTYSLVYNTLDRKEEYLELAENMYRFLKKCEGEDGRLPFIVNREGAPLVVNDDYYSETFAAIGCAEYYLATGRIDLLASAEKYFDIAYALYKKSLEPTDAPSAAPATKALGPSMIMLSTAQVLRKTKFDKYHRIARECADEILTHLTPKGLLENVLFDGGFLDTPHGREVNPGHSLEAAWFLLAEGIYRSNEKYRYAARQIIDLSMSLGYRDGGIIAFCDCDGHPSTHLEWDMKIWWPQCEAIIANMLCYRSFGDKKYLDYAMALKEYCFSRYADPEHGEWFGYLHYDGTLAETLKGNISKGPFHLPRMLILMHRMEKGLDLL